MARHGHRGTAALALAAGLLFVNGCATKGYVDDRVAELGTRTEADDARLRADLSSGLEKTGRSAEEALARASAARELALGNVDYRPLEEWTIHFAFDSAELSAESRATLDDAAATAAGNPRALVDILGHADTTGPDAYNDDLSRRRAAAVMKYLILHGPGPVSRYAVVGLGETSPVTAAGVEDRPGSRRVVVAMLERAEPSGTGRAEEEPVISRADDR